MRGEVASPAQLRMGLVRRALFTVPVVVALGFASGALGNAGSGMRWYAILDKPSFQPASWAFGVAWSMLYPLIGFALAVVLSARGSPLRARAVALFIAQFVFNLAWSPVFFAMRQPVAGFVIIVLMVLLTAATTAVFFRVRRFAGWLMVPYLAWLCFAAVLNGAIVQLNPDGQRLVPPGVRTQIGSR